MEVLRRDKICSQLINCSPLDRYALGYCIANCSSVTSWKVKMINGSGESFMWGLNSNHCGNGTICYLEMNRVSQACFDSYPSTILSGINHLRVDENMMISLVQEISRMNNLTSLHLLADVMPFMVCMALVQYHVPYDLAAKKITYERDHLSSPSFLFHFHNITF